ncbi:unnamed protein product [marine sediment metagenome]|uniref:DUF5658 domain-containing protein n=1 Tax=marine sediment metagenome TaxID=412755 RepID=X0VIV3_9ZZZZ
MNLLNKYVSFSIIVLLLAVMDGLNFVMPHDTGFYSLTSGYFDAFHLSKFIILLIIGIQFIWSKDKWQTNMLRLCALGVIAFIGQLLVYNFLFKLEVL